MRVLFGQVTPYLPVQEVHLRYHSNPSCLM